MRLDLTKELETFTALIATGVAAFVKSRPAKTAKPITRIDVKYDLTTERHPRVWVVLDTEPAGEPDSGHSETYQIAERVCKHWAKPCHAADERPVTVVRPGATAVVEDEETLYEAVGLFFVGIVRSMRDAGAFADLPRATNCYLGVSAEDQTYGWPDYEDRGPDNMV